MERNRKAGQNPPRVVAPIEEEEEEDAPISQVYCLTFIYSSTCFGRPQTIIRSSITAVAACGFTIGAWW
jgi:hypothetical protein